MIYLTQGHERSISLEIFLKAFQQLSVEEQQKIVLICNLKTLEEQKTLLKISNENLRNLKIVESRNQQYSETLASLIEALKVIGPKDLLLTLPTSKDQLEFCGKKFLGYTEFLRYYYKDNELCMTFKSDEETLLLMTDHIPLKEVPAVLKTNLIKNKIEVVLENHRKFYSEFEDVIVAGINPHSGENGLIGSEDLEVIHAVELLKEHYPHINFVGPVSGDTLYYKKKTERRQLFVYMFHDQGLPVFKALYGYKGINLTLGLPFLRMSVDHGTAFDLYGKNKANAEGCLYLLKHAIERERKINGT